MNDASFPATPVTFFVDEDLLARCVHCGFCLPACPTYLELGTETDSPRGRIYLIRALQDGSTAPSNEVIRHLDLCLGCRACEPACPSGVRFGELIDHTRVILAAAHRRPWRQHLWRTAITAVLPRPGRLRWLLTALALVQKLGLFRLLAARIPWVRLVLQISKTGPLPALNPAPGRERQRVGLFPGCVSQELFGTVNRAAVRVLNRNGIGVVVPPGDHCCGALHLHNGDRARAQELARRTIAAFPDELETIVVTAAGCGAVMKAYGDLLREDVRSRERAATFAAKVRDVTEYVAGLELRPPTGRLAARVGCHDPCHLAHAQGIRHSPRRLLLLIPGVELVEISESDICCGSAGTYNLIEPAMARRLRQRKIDNIVRAGITCVAAANPGCILQIQAGLKERGLAIRVAHPIELLDEAYDPEPCAMVR